jgi:ubiquinone/menaquinone biosynthesis C-methylase UbiE
MCRETGCFDCAAILAIHFLKSMSTYENYNHTSQVYDKTRSADGVEIIRSALAENKLPLGKQILVDAGCGTGLFAAAMVNHVQRIEAVDLNPGMLAKAQEKMVSEEKSGRINFHQSSIDALPLPDESVDAVMTNQVLHHLPDDESSSWPKHRKVFQEFSRVLKPGGILIVNSSSHQQLEQGFWYFRFIPKALQAVKEKHVDLDMLSELLQRSGFTNIHHKVPLKVVLQSEALFNAEGPLDPDWRSGDSTWSLVSDKDLPGVLKHIKTLRDSGKLEAFMQEHDKPRAAIGQITFTIARKQLSA